MLTLINSVERAEPFDHADCLFEAKFDGFRAAADTVRGRLISWNGNRVQRLEEALDPLPKGPSSTVPAGKLRMVGVGHWLGDDTLKVNIDRGPVERPPFADNAVGGEAPRASSLSLSAACAEQVLTQAIASTQVLGSYCGRTRL
jgi:hypothetical protein